MRLSQNIEATRVHGTLDVELADGRTAIVEVDLDVSDNRTAWGIEHQYNNPEDFGLFSGPVRVVSTKFYVEVPPSIHRDDDPPFTLRIPTDG